MKKTMKKPEKLSETTELMVSTDYKERFQAEYFQLLIRYNGLKRILDNWDAGKLNFTPTCPKGIYNYQVKAMKDYLDVLEMRADIEKVNIKNIQAKVSNQVNDLATNLLDTFDTFLQEKDVAISCTDDEEENSRSAKIYGMEYYDLLERVEHVLKGN
mgnify:CR=1 FL=1